jgi:hypothetical protein
MALLPVVILIELISHGSTRRLRVIGAGAIRLVIRLLSCYPLRGDGRWTDCANGRNEVHCGYMRKP